MLDEAKAKLSQLREDLTALTHAFSGTPSAGSATPSPQNKMDYPWGAQASGSTSPRLGKDAAGPASPVMWDRGATMAAMQQGMQRPESRESQKAPSREVMKSWNNLVYQEQPTPGPHAGILGNGQVPLQEAHPPQWRPMPAPEPPQWQPRDYTLYPQQAVYNQPFPLGYAQDYHPGYQQQAYHPGYAEWLSRMNGPPPNMNQPLLDPMGPGGLATLQPGMPGQAPIQAGNPPFHDNRGRQDFPGSQDFRESVSGDWTTGSVADRSRQDTLHGGSASQRQSLDATLPSAQSQYLAGFQAPAGAAGQPPALPPPIGYQPSPPNFSPERWPGMATTAMDQQLQSARPKHGLHR